MITRRALFAAPMVGAAIGSEGASACPAAQRLFRANETDHARMLGRATRIRSLFNRGEMEALIGRDENLSLTLHSSRVRENDRVSTLRQLRERWGRMLTPVTWDNCLIWPEGAFLYFVAAMELRPEIPDDPFARACGPVRGHDQFLFRLRFSVDQATGRLTDRLLVLNIGTASV